MRGIALKLECIPAGELKLWVEPADDDITFEQTNNVLPPASRSGKASGPTTKKTGVVSQWVCLLCARVCAHAHA
jgi:hypothetical protein